MPDGLHPKGAAANSVVAKMILSEVEKLGLGVAPDAAKDDNYGMAGSASALLPVLPWHDALSR